MKIPCQKKNPKKFSFFLHEKKFFEKIKSVEILQVQCNIRDLLYCFSWSSQWVHYSLSPHGFYSHLYWWWMKEAVSVRWSWVVTLTTYIICSLAHFVPSLFHDCCSQKSQIMFVKKFWKLFQGFWIRSMLSF